MTKIVLTPQIVAAYPNASVQVDGKIFPVLAVDYFNNRILLNDDRDDSGEVYYPCADCKLVLSEWERVGRKDNEELCQIIAKEHGFHLVKNASAALNQYKMDFTTHMKVIHYCQNNSIDVGHLGIPSLIEAGIAIKKEGENEEV